MRGRCRPCDRADARERYHRNPLAQRWRQIKHKYGLEPWQYGLMLMVQQGRCSICKRHVDEIDRGPFLPVDHCHTTGRVRGLLCNDCNQGIGFLEASGANLGRVAAYLGSDDLSL